MKLIKILTPALALAAGLAFAQADFTPARLQSGGFGSVPYGTQSGGIAAFRLEVDASGAVAGSQPVQEFAPYGDAMRQALPAWRFEPAREGGAAVASPILVLGLFRPPALSFAAPEVPRFKETKAPEDVPWPTAVTVQNYPARTTGSGVVILEVEVGREGSVSGTRVVSAASAFDGAATSAVAAWKFRPAMRKNREAASRLYVILTFIGEIAPMK
jgi:TonB family protein